MCRCEGVYRGVDIGVDLMRHRRFGKQVTGKPTNIAAV
jgi:hypothetical protein